MLSVCLRAIQQFTRADIRLVVLCRKDTIEEETCGLLRDHGAELVEVDVDLAPDVSSKIHGMMLDSFLPDSVDTEYVMTLDSDCFPVRNGWLTMLLDMLNPGGAKISGILHPWAPPPEDMQKSKIEWRVRSQHCWEMTHVACQLLRTDDLKELISLGAVYNGGDDTGLLIPKIAKEKGWRIDGFKPSRCPTCPRPGMEFDPEFNRYVCLVFGDMVYHHGGFSRTESFGDEPMFERSFGWAREKILAGGAAWLLEDKWSYRFKFNREEKVAAEKMQRLFGMHADRMPG
jgi:hypothetical protein